MAKILETAGYQVKKAYCSLEALAVVRESGPPLVLIADVQLPPGLNGIALARRICRKWPYVGTVFITGYEFDFGRYNLGALEKFLQKPIRMRELVVVIQQVMDTVRELLLHRQNETS